MSEDAIREVHGCKSIGDRHIILKECDDAVLLESMGDRRLTPHQARYLAAKLYRMARRINTRTVSLPPPRSNDDDQ